MTFFERYFERSTGRTRTRSLELVAEDVEFSIQWADGADRRAASSSAASRSCAASPTPATRAAGRITCLGGADGDVEFALGETRWDDGQRIGTFLAVAQLDGDGRMRRYMVARTPAIAFDDRSGRCRQRD